MGCVLRRNWLFRAILFIINQAALPIICLGVANAVDRVNTLQAVTCPRALVLSFGGQPEGFRRVSRYGYVLIRDGCERRSRRRTTGASGIGAARRAADDTADDAAAGNKHREREGEPLGRAIRASGCSSCRAAERPARSGSSLRYHRGGARTKQKTQQVLPPLSTPRSSARMCSVARHRLCTYITNVCKARRLVLSLQGCR